MSRNFLLLAAVIAIFETRCFADYPGAGVGGNIELHLDTLARTLIGSCAAPATGGWQGWANASCAVSDTTAKGVHDLYLKFTGAGGTNLFNFNYWQFQSSTNNQSPISLVKFEAESGALGADWAVSNSASPAYISITTDWTGNSPSNSTRVATYTVTFPTPGTYQLYARVRVGSGGFNDDSMFYGNGFGIKNPTNASDWILVNGLAGVGFNNPSDVVTGGGTLGSGVWKWINLSLFAPGPAFTVTTTNLTQTFQIGARENGLDIDAFAFGLNYYTYTVSNLDAGVDGTPPSAGVCNIDWTNVLQRIDGFGGGAVFLDAGLDPVASTNMDTVFNTNTPNQLGLTLLRVRIDPTTNWTTALSDAQKAVARGARVMATPWTPPASMKTNNNLVGGALSVSQYANYAKYLNSFAGYMKSNGVQLAAVSIQNEPDFLATYESCIWSSDQFLSFVKTNAAAITNAPVMMPESFHFDQSLSDPTLNDSTAVTNFSIVAGHLYGATISDYPGAHMAGKPTWMTEYLVNDQTIDAAIATAQQIHDCLTTGNMSAYVWWKILGNANGLVSASGIPQKRGFVMAQFSRFVRPGFNRIAATNNGSVLVTAYRNTNSAAFAIVAINPTGIPLTPTFNLQNFSAVASLAPWMTSPDVSFAIQSAVALTNSTFTYTLPGLSVVTFVGRANFPPALAAVANQSINAGVTLLVTNFASDPDLPAQSLTFTLLTSPTNATLTSLNASNALVTWRPLVSQPGTTNLFAVKVADDGTPGLSATNNFTVTVNPLGSQPSFSSIVPGGNFFNLTIAGPVGPDYSLWASTNLLDWESLLTSNSPVTPFVLTVTNRNEPSRYYRILIGP
jgi:glucuronoarabinoxylan endo-1,4-beta-xylanase